MQTTAIPPTMQHQCIELGTPIRSKWYFVQPEIRRSPQETIMRKAVFMQIKSVRFAFKRALATGSSVAVNHAKDKMDLVSFFIRNYKNAFSKLPE